MRAAIMMLSLATGSAAFGGSIEPLDRLRWEHRALLVFSPGPADQRAARLDAHLAARDCEVRDRDLVVFRLPLGASGRLDKDVLTHDEVARLREVFEASDGAFIVVLVGKDGGEKLRTVEPPDLDDVFALIDGMPMRRSEMAARDRGCATDAPLTTGDVHQRHRDEDRAWSA